MRFMNSMSASWFCVTFSLRYITPPCTWLLREAMTISQSLTSQPTLWLVLLRRRSWQTMRSRVDCVSTARVKLASFCSSLRTFSMLIEYSVLGSRAS